MKNLLLILTILISSVVYSQTLPTDTMFVENVDTSFIELCIFNEINDYRESNGLNRLVLDTTLSISARKWVVSGNAMKGNGTNRSLVHEGGNWAECLSSGNDGNNWFTYEQIAKMKVKTWKESTRHNDQLLYENLSYGGVGISFNEGEYSGYTITAFRSDPMYFTVE